MKVSLKLILGFLIVALLTAAVGIIGIYGMLQINTSFTNMYDNQTVPMPYMTKIIESMQRQRACMREYIIGAAVISEAGDNAQEAQDGIDLVNDAHSRVLTYQQDMDQYLALYKETINTSTDAGANAMAMFTEAETIYHGSFMTCLDTIYNGAMAGGDPYELYKTMGDYTADINKVADNFEQCLTLKIQVASDANDAGDALFTTLLTVIIVVLVLAVIIAMFLGVYISNLISKPLTMLANFMKKAGNTGDISISPDEGRAIAEFSRAKDEIGQTIAASSSFINHVTNISNELKTIADGDLSVSVATLSDADTMGSSLRNMVSNLNSMFSEIRSSTSQVSTGSKQIADGAQSLAQGSTEQAASVQQLSASITEIAEKTKENATMATKAATLANTIKGSAEKGSRQMDEMMTAVNDINQASHNISKIIKVIDDIAFQTNILALNAAVEAARAGQHGKGFAVVAEEVRNLAAKSAEAARETGDMIQSSMEKAEFGSRIAGETATSLAEIVSGINESSKLVSEIASSSEAQSLGITQINTGIDQVAQVVQQNSATAEQSAAASEEMSSQSSLLEELISQFKLAGETGRLQQRSAGSAPGAAAPAKKRLAMPEKGSFDAKSNDYGKY
ncbi:MAG: methyl-accepting chemotaxis protein [Oscillospiraceae bacterium]|nr:methyl-accepting chemotaxis protein [Oscillospiraceae bacterium]